MVSPHVCAVRLSSHNFESIQNCLVVETLITILHRLLIIFSLTDWRLGFGLVFSNVLLRSIPGLTNIGRLTTWALIRLNVDGLVCVEVVVCFKLEGYLRLRVLFLFFLFIHWACLHRHCPNRREQLKISALGSLKLEFLAPSWCFWIIWFYRGRNIGQNWAIFHVVFKLTLNCRFLYRISPRELYDGHFCLPLWTLLLHAKWRAIAHTTFDGIFCIYLKLFQVHKGLSWLELAIAK